MSSHQDNAQPGSSPQAASGPGESTSHGVNKEGYSHKFITPTNKAAGSRQLFSQQAKPRAISFGAQEDLQVKNF